MALLVAFVISLLTTPLARKLAVKVGAIDMPGKAGTARARHLHASPTPRMGGLAIFLGFFFSVLLFAPMGSKNISMLIGATIIVILGALDDIYDIPARQKLVVQIIAAAVAAAGGNQIHFFSRLMALNGGHFQLGVLAVPATLLWIVLITNAVNLIDGLDGLAAGVSTISCVSLVIIALVYSNPGVAILTSALASVNPDYYKAARVDGTSKGRIFLRITLPMISPMVFYLIVTGFIGAFKAYSDAVALFGTDLNAAGMNTIVGYVYDMLYGDFPSYASAAAIILFAIVLTITCINLLVSKKHVHY